MTRPLWLKIGMGVMGMLVAPFLAAFAGDVTVMAIFPKWHVADGGSWLLALYLLGCIYSGLAVPIALSKSRGALWAWIAISIAVVLFGTPIILLFSIGFGEGRTVLAVWAMALAELTVVWAAALGGRYVFLNVKVGQSDG